MYREGRNNNEVLENHVARLWLAPQLLLRPNSVAPGAEYGSI
jgi:hypothetical protein